MDSLKGLGSERNTDLLEKTFFSKCIDFTYLLSHVDSPHFQCVF